MRKMDSSNKLLLIKVCLCFLGLFYWVSGVVLMCIGVAVQMKLHETFMVMNEASSGVPVIITIVGGVIISISAFGAIAILKSSHTMTKLFTGMLMIIFSIEIIVGISAYACREKLHDNLLRGFLKTLDKYNRDSQITREVDNLQENGCVQKLKKWAEEHIAHIGGVGISVGFAQLLGILFSYMLLRTLKEDYVNL
ncbi:tetraspanin-6-like isoform X2 [Emydura macquarii macquarii]|uniref:tetraspanin-6-like isoform X2 n=1 Tax=Emydura macquarii macquarii TaxID=1129001 RepID=UPI00352ABE38